VVKNRGGRVYQIEIVELECLRSIKHKAALMPPRPTPVAIRCLRLAIRFLIFPLLSPYFLSPSLWYDYVGLTPGAISSVGPCTVGLTMSTHTLLRRVATTGELTSGRGVISLDAILYYLCVSNVLFSCKSRLFICLSSFIYLLKPSGNFTYHQI
jgi:hypothetical protein